MMTLEKFEEASELVKKVTNPTKLVFSEYLSTQTGAKVYLKPENMQHTGAYKIRGAYYKISTLTEEERNRGLITASAGNHAQGVAFAAEQRAMGQKLYFMGMYTMMHISMPASLQKKMATHLCIRLMIWMSLPVRDRLQWRSYRNFRQLIIFLSRSVAVV